MVSNISCKIIELFEDVYIIPSKTNVGVIADKTSENNELYLIDSGSSDFDGNYILEVIDFFFTSKNEEYTIKAIINTHAHPDHIGANNYIKNMTGCQIWAPAKEIASMENTETQTNFFWGGFAPKQMHTPLFKPEPVRVNRALLDNQTISLKNGNTITVIDLPGHSYQSIGLLVCSNRGKILFSGDSLFTRDKLAKHWISFNLNPQQFLDSLNRMEEISDLTWCIPSHGDFIQKNFQETIELNKISVMEIKQNILNIITKEELTTDQIIKKLADTNDLNMNFTQYILISSTIKSFLSVLCNEGKIKYCLKDNTLFWNV